MLLHSHPRWLAPLLLALVSAGGGATGAAEIDVVASIKPVHSLVAGVMRGVGEPSLLVKSAGSEHSYSLRPSEARALEQAEVVFWIGESLETFLLKPLGALAGDAELVELWRVPGLTLLPTRSGGMWDGHGPGDQNADQHAGEDAGRHDEEGWQADALARERSEAPHGAGGDVAGETDMHLWLDPANAKVLVAAIARALGKADPDHAPTYLANAGRLHERLDELDRRLEDQLATIAGRPYVVFHDAYQYFEQRYGVSALGAITVNPTLRPSAQRLAEIQGRLRELEVSCVFAEPQFEPALVDVVIEGTPARKGVLDPLGATLEAGPDQYFRLLSGLADALVDCLGGAQSG